MKDMTRQQMIEEACRRKGDRYSWHFHLSLNEHFGGQPVSPRVVEDVKWFFRQIEAEQFASMQPN